MHGHAHRWAFIGCSCPVLLPIVGGRWSSLVVLVVLAALDLVPHRAGVDALDAVLRDRASVKYRHDLDSTRPLANLSKKQLGVLSLVSQGMSNSQIADLRGTTIRAVEGMVSRVFEALNISTYADGNARVEAARTFLKATGNISGE